MVKDTYKTIKNSSEGVFKDKGSKFYSFAYPIESEEEVKSKLKELKKTYHDARHHCYAYNIGPGDKIYRMNDDGEPSGTAGRPIYGQIQINELSDILIVVVRYFGGVLLGTSGLINAYRCAADEAIKSAQLIDKIVTNSFDLCFSYELLSHVMHIIKDEKLKIIKQEQTDKCLIRLNVRLGDTERLKDLFAKIFGVQLIE